MNNETEGDETTPAPVPNLRFPEFRDAGEWASAAFREFYNFKPTNSYSRDQLNYESGSVRNIHYGDIHTKYSTLFRLADARVPFINTHISIDTISVDAYCQEGDMVFADASEDLSDVGKSMEIVSLNGERLLSGSHTILARHQTNTLIVGFAGHLFKGRRIRAQIEREAQGTKVLQISPIRLAGISIVYPRDKAEQQRIADCLGSLDELVAAQARKVEALNAHKKGLMQQLFPQEGETQPRLRFSEFQDAGEWEARQFEDFVAKSFYGTSSSTSPTGQYPVLRMGNMADGGLDFTNLVYIDLEPDSFELFRLEDGDILLNRTNSPALVGKISIFRLKSECITASYIVSYRLIKERIVPLFCNLMLNTPLHQAKVKALAKPSVSQANINPTTFKKELIVAVPSLAEQQRIADCLTSLDDLITAESTKLSALKTHKKGLMQQLFPTPAED